MTAKWTCIDVACGGSVAEELAAEVADEFQTGAQVTDEGIRFYCDEGDEGSVFRKLGAILEPFQQRYPEEPFAIRSSLLLGDDWADGWKVFFKPLRIGRRFLICPTWETPPDGDDDLLILMDPGRAFGTGRHETTRLCLEWIEEWADGGGRKASFLDVGTGSGVLSVAAALAGAERVTGVDNDPEAVEVAQENVLLNNLSHKVDLLQGSIEDVEGRFDAVVSNIQSMPLIAMAEEMVRRVADDGVLALSGILEEQKTDVLKAYEACGLKSTGVRVAGEWVLLVFKRPGKDDS